MTKIFLDCADLNQIIPLKAHPLASGFTTNPSLIRKAGAWDYSHWCQCAAVEVSPLPISIEVLADDLSEMEQQAKVIARWGSNVSVKIPITNTKGVFTGPVISALVQQGISVNVTAVLVIAQMDAVGKLLTARDYLSVFAGRISDTRRDPMPFIRYARHSTKAQIIWASAREVWNVEMAEQCQCHIITLPPDLFAKLPLKDKSLQDFSLETVAMFYSDAQAAGYAIAAPGSFGAGGFNG